MEKHFRNLRYHGRSHAADGSQVRDAWLLGRTHHRSLPSKHYPSADALKFAWGKPPSAAALYAGGAVFGMLLAMRPRWHGLVEAALASGWVVFVLGST